MKTQNIIQASCNVIKLVNLKKGDVFKSVKAEAYSNGITYNIVLELYNDGKNSFIEVLQYEKGYNEVKATNKVFNGTDDISIFPATIEEVGEYFKDALDSIEESIVTDKENLHKKIVACDKAKEFVKGELSKNIQLAEFSEQTQEEYQSKKVLKEVKIKELSDEEF